MKTIINVYSGGISGRLLAKKLGIEVGTCKTANVINWGSTSRIVTSGNILNNPLAVLVSTNKHLARLIMKMNGIPTIEFSGFPIIARPPSTSMGKNVLIIESLADAHRIPRGWSITTIFKKEKEFRVHVFRGKVLLISDKNIASNQIVGNWHINRNTWRVLKWDEFDPEMCRICVLAVKCLGLDFGAVDIMVDNEGKYAICEVNTAPCLGEGEISLSKYIMVFNAWINGCNKEFNKNFKNGRSWAWKKKDLE